MDLQSGLFCYEHITILTFLLREQALKLQTEYRTGNYWALEQVGWVRAVNGDNPCNVAGFCFGEKILEVIFISIFNLFLTTLASDMS